MAESFPGKPDAVQSLQEALAIFGAEGLELPAGLSSVRILAPFAHLAYDDKAALLSDVEAYYVEGKGELDTLSDVTLSTDRGADAMRLMTTWGDRETSRIFGDLEEELTDWITHGAHGTFLPREVEGGRTPYKYSGSPFEGSAISVSLSPDGKFLLGISGEGMHASRYDPSDKLVEFAAALDKKVDYDGMPGLELLVEPSEAELERYASQPMSKFSPHGHRGAKVAPQVLSASVQGLADLYGRVTGLGSIELNQDMTRLVERNGGYVQALEISVGKTLLTINDWDGDAALDGQGHLLLPFEIYAEDGKQLFYRPKLNLHAKNGSVSQGQVNEIVGRARLYGDHVENRNWSTIAGWKRLGRRTMELVAQIPGGNESN